MARPLVGGEKKKPTTWLLRAGLIASIPQTKGNLTVKMWRLTKIGSKWIQNINKPIKSHVRNQSIGQSAGHSCWTVHLKPSIAHGENSACWFGGMEETDWRKEEKKKMKSSKLLIYRFQGKNIVVTRTYSYFWFKGNIQCWLKKEIYHLHWY